MKKIIPFIGIMGILVLILASTYFLAPENKIDPSIIEGIITPSQAHLLCDKSSCPTGQVVIQGDLSGAGYGTFTLKDEEKSLSTSFRGSNLSLLDTIIIQENLKLTKNGVIEVRIKGTLSYDCLPINYDCLDIVNFNIGPEEIEVISEVGCKDPSEGRFTLEAGDCFDTSYRKLSLEEAYKMFFSSIICTEKERKPSGSFTYQIDEERWAMGIHSPTRPGGCYESCLVDENKVIYSRTCAAGGSGTAIELEENNIDLKSFSELYGACIEKNSLELISAEDELVGTIRYDEYNSPWVKNEEGLWEGVIGIYFSQYRHDEESKNAPLGTIQNETVDSYGWVWKKVSEIEWKGFERVQKNITSEKVNLFPGGLDYERDLAECDKYLKTTL